MSRNGNEKRSLSSRIAVALSLVALFTALAGGAYAASQIGSKDIKANAVKSKQIKDGAVKTAELGAGAVSTDKLAGGAVDATKLADGSVTTPKIADGAVGSQKIENGAIGTVDIANDAVNTAKLQDGVVTSAKAGAGVLRDMIIVEDREPNAGETASATKQAFATCPEGYVATGGGGRILGDAAAKDVLIDVNAPIIESAPGLKQWFVEAQDISGAASAEDYAITATAICVKA